MKLARKLALTAAAPALVVSMIGMSAPAAHAGDSSWGCGGACRGVPPVDGGDDVPADDAP